MKLSILSVTFLIEVSQANISELSVYRNVSRCFCFFLVVKAKVVLVFRSFSVKSIVHICCIFLFLSDKYKYMSVRKKFCNYMHFLRYNEQNGLFCQYNFLPCSIYYCFLYNQNLFYNAQFCLKFLFLFP